MWESDVEGRLRSIPYPLLPSTQDEKRKIRSQKNERGFSPSPLGYLSVPWRFSLSLSSVDFSLSPLDDFHSLSPVDFLSPSLSLPVYFLSLSLCYLPPYLNIERVGLTFPLFVHPSLQVLPMSSPVVSLEAVRRVKE